MVVGSLVYLHELLTQGVNSFIPCAPAANIVTSICLFVSFIIWTALFVEIAAALRNCPGMPSKMAREEERHIWGTQLLWRGDIIGSDDRVWSQLAASVEMT